MTVTRPKGFFHVHNSAPNRSSCFLSICHRMHLPDHTCLELSPPPCLLKSCFYCDALISCRPLSSVSLMLRSAFRVDHVSRRWLSRPFTRKECELECDEVVS